TLTWPACFSGLIEENKAGGARWNFETMLTFTGRIAIVLQRAVIWTALLLLVGCTRSPEMVKQHSMAAGTELMKRGDYRRALLEFKNAVQVMPRDAEAQYQLGNAFLATGDASSAMTAYKRATDLQPRHAEAQKRLAHLMTVLGDRNLVEDAEK